MSSARITVDVDGTHPVAHRFRTMGRKALDARPVWRRVTRWLLEDEAKVFAAQPWEHLAESTRERKARQGLDPRTLRARGQLHDALTKPRARGGMKRMTRDSLIVGVNPKGPLWWAIFHKRGTSNMPARDPFPLNARRYVSIREAVRDHLLERG